METLKELYQYIVDKYFTLDTGSLENISLGNSVISLPLMFFALFLGVILAALGALYNKRLLGGALRKIIASGANSPESAKTLEELGYSKNAFVRSALKSGTAMRKYVHCVEDDEAAKSLVPDKKGYLPKIKTDLSASHFYVPEEARVGAELRYDKTGTTWFAFFGIIVVGIVIIVLLIKFLPELLKLLDNFVGSVKPDDRIVR